MAHSNIRLVRLRLLTLVYARRGHLYEISLLSGREFDLRTLVINAHHRVHSSFQQTWAADVTTASLRPSSHTGPRSQSVAMTKGLHV